MTLQYKDGNARFTTVCLITYELYIHVFVSVDWLFSFVASLQKLLAHFLLIRDNGEIHRKKKQCTSKENNVIFHIYDQITRVQLEIGHCFHCIAIAQNYVNYPWNVSYLNPLLPPIQVLAGYFNPKLSSGVLRNIYSELTDAGLQVLQEQVFLIVSRL